MAGGTVGALLRHVVATTWPLPHQLLVSTILTVGCAFLVATALLASGTSSAAGVVVLGVCGSTASLSAWAVLTISQPMRLSLAFLVGVPVVAVVGLFLGLVVARAVAR